MVLRSGVLYRYQLQGERLQVENIKLSEELDSQKTSLKDINEFLTNELKARSVTTSALEKTIAELEEKLEDQKSSYEVEMKIFSAPLSDLIVLLQHEYAMNMRGR